MLRTMTQNNKPCNYTYYFLLVLLAITSFGFGSMFSENKYLKANPSNVAANNNAPAQPQAPQQPAKAIDLEAIVTGLDLDYSAVEACASSDKYKQKVADQAAAGKAANVQGTPAVLVINRETNKSRVLPGAVPFESIKTAIDEVLTGENDTPATPNASEIDPTKIPEVTAEDWVKGNRDAKIALIEYSDFECPFCQQFHASAQQALDTYPNDLQWVYRHFPLDFHPNANKYAYTAECAAELGGNDAFWAFADKIFE
jgi:protein-disulfide isomerase